MSRKPADRKHLYASLSLPQVMRRLLVFGFLLSACTGLQAQQLPLDVTSADDDGVELSSGDASQPTTSTLRRAMRWLLQSQRQRRADLLEQGDFETLTEATGNNHWQAEADYRQAEYEKAADRFAELADESESAPYNQATALARAGQLDDALALYNEILSRDPDHADALHNRDIVEQMKQQAQEQSSQQQGDENSDKSESDDQEKGQEPDNSDTEQQQSQNSSDQQSADQQSGEQQNSSTQEQQDTEQSQQQQEVDLDALTQNQDLTEQQQQARDQLEQQAREELATAEPLSEQQQATEQWLRQIPDDPSGLLRRKLQQTHTTDYPNIRNSSQPW